MTEPTRKVVRHASHPEPDRALCGARNGSRTRPKEQVNCPECRVILNHVRDRYPAHARYGDWRLTREQKRRATARMAADMYGGDDD
jgi:hypothetical protein